MRVAIFGTGYVGLVTGTCLAEVGHHVICIDIDEIKIKELQKGIIPIFEPGLAPMVKNNQDAERLTFTTDTATALTGSDIILIAVGTPPDEDGSADLRHVETVARSIGDYLQQPSIIVNKSTVPVGTADRVRTIIGTVLRQRNVEIDFDVVSNPEFLKEGDAINDCMRPDRIIIGSSNPRTIEEMKRLYMPFNRNHDRIVVMDVHSAELTKYAANAMLATKISFMNEMAGIAERVGADIEHVRRGIGSDPRIGWHFIYPGAGYGGSCFPKDVQALVRTAKNYGYDAALLQTVEDVNDRQKNHLFDLIERHYGEATMLRGKTFAVWGLAFKPNTDDMRAAPSRRLLAQLWQAGVSVRAYDPEALNEAKRLFGATRNDTVWCDSADSALDGADGLIIVTEWKEFRIPNFLLMHQLLADKVIFDGRNLYEPSEVESAGLKYYGIGRGRSVRRATATQDDSRGRT